MAKLGSARRFSLRSFSFLLSVGILFLFLVSNLFFGLDGVGTPPSNSNTNKKQQQQLQAPTRIPVRNISAYRSILPQRVYSVIGLESSGTRFVSGILSKALGTGKHRNGPLPGVPQTQFRGGTQDVWVQHLSLPWGGNCDKVPIPQILPVILPGVCSTGRDEYRDACEAMAKDANMTLQESNGKAQYPKRWLLDMVHHRDFYESLGVRQIYIVIVRDTTIARQGRVEHKYCTNETLLLQEEAIGTDLMKAAIRKYLLQDNHGNESSNNSSIVSGNDFVVLSYESLMSLGDTYIQMLYETLGIQSEYWPEIHDGNPKYVQAASANASTA